MEEEEEDDVSVPSLYDYFYFDFAILKEGLSFRKELLKNKDRELLAGYLYFIEFCIGKIIQHVEEAPYNEHIFEIVNWGRFDIGDKEIQHLKKNSHSFRTIFELLEHRKELSSIRHTLTKPDAVKDNAVEEVLKKLEKLNNEIDSEIATLYKATKAKGINDIAEKSMIFHWFMVTYVYEPPRMFFSTMTDEIARSYVPELQYLKGFKVCTALIMNWLTENKYNKQINDGLSELHTLGDMHQFYSKMNGPVFKDIDITRIFDIVEPRWRTSTLLKNKKILYPYQLNVVFRGREIKVINVLEDIVRSDRDAVQRLFIDALSGGIVLGGSKVEIIEFEEIVKEGKDWDKYYSYALYLPMHGMIGDASSWVIFPRLDGESNWEPYDEVKEYLQRIMEKRKDRISLTKYKIKTGLLEKYIENKDRGLAISKSEMERLKASRGLLTEFLAYLCLSKFYNAKLLSIEREEKDTDIDIIAENKDFSIIVQAKTSLPLDKKQLEKEIDDIIKHFRKIEPSVGKDKPVKKFLFYVTWELGKNYDDGVARFGDNSFAYVLNRKLLLQSKLKKEDIGIINFRQLKSALTRDKKFDKVLNKLKLIFEMFDEGEELLL
jgi:hypothetical protein